MSFLVEHAHNKRIEELERQVAALKRFLAAMFSRPDYDTPLHYGSNEYYGPFHGEIEAAWVEAFATEGGE